MTPPARSRIRVAVAFAGAVTLSLAALGFGAETASAAPATLTAASTSIDSHPQDTGTVHIDFGTNLAGFTVTSTAADPTAPGTFSVVSGDIGSDGFVTLTNYAGWADLELTSLSGPSEQLAGPVSSTFRYDIGIWRAQTVDYTYSETQYGPLYTLTGSVPQPIIPPTGADAEALTPLATATMSPATWQPGSDVTLQFSDVTPTGVGYPMDSVTVGNVVYSDATVLGSSTIRLMSGGFSYSFTVPGAYTSGGHVAASFDLFGRLFLIDPLDVATPTPTPAPSTPAATTVVTTSASSTLANTGQNDLVPAGIGALTLFGAGAIGLVIARHRRRASGNRS
ncbi:MAG: hypothetical protein JWQ19_1360 [Subtercola sp.]|nr:hypothetical protein [Subtercola sp.]